LVYSFGLRNLLKAIDIYMLVITGMNLAANSMFRVGFCLLDSTRC
jgi:hypothetical protein